jgi:Tetrapyrrole (Corrin/Porphyrin) Methylases
VHQINHRTRNNHDHWPDVTSHSTLGYHAACPYHPVPLPVPASPSPSFPSPSFPSPSFPSPSFPSPSFPSPSFPSRVPAPSPASPVSSPLTFAPKPIFRTFRIVHLIVPALRASGVVSSLAARGETQAAAETEVTSAPAPHPNHDDVTSSWSGPPRCDIVVVEGSAQGAESGPVALARDGSRLTGRVVFVGADPGAPALLTQRGAHAIQQADIVIGHRHRGRRAWSTTRHRLAAGRTSP